MLGDPRECRSDSLVAKSGASYCAGAILPVTGGDKNTGMKIGEGPWAGYNSLVSSGTLARDTAQTWLINFKYSTAI